MKNTIFKGGVLFFLCAFFAISCSEPSVEKVHPDLIAATAPDLKGVTTNLPEAQGSRVFNANCAICHSTRYIQDQPDMSGKAWTAIVTKMQKTFGAPVSDSSAKEIVKYLVTIKGKN